MRRGIPGLAFGLAGGVVALVAIFWRGERAVTVFVALATGGWRFQNGFDPALLLPAEAKCKEEPCDLQGFLRRERRDSNPRPPA
jgi:hypothetical protein